MQDHETHYTAVLSSIRVRTLTVCLMVGVLPLTGALWAQSPETTEPKTQEIPGTSAEETLEPESSPPGCPNCGQARRGQGQGKGCCGGGKGRGGRGRGQGQGQRGQGRGCPSGDCGRPEAQVIHFLIENHQSLERTVEEIPGGVLTRTISQDPEIVDALRTHVRQMEDLIHGGGRIRNWDPLFREIFDRREAIEMEISDIEGGVEVTETSADEQVIQLIRAHAVKVEEFVARGLEAYQEETPLPAGYSEASP